MPWQSWDRAWQRALYARDGFYRRPEGPGGHFATSAQGLGSAGTALGGWMLAEALLTLARRHGLTRVVEIGAGRGELLTSLEGVAAQARESADGSEGPVLHLLGLDVVARPQGLLERVDWLRSPGGARLPQGLTGLDDALVVAHEWLDVVPCVLAMRDSPERPWRRLEIDTETGETRSGARIGPAGVAWLTEHAAPDATRAELGLARDAAYADLVSRVDSGLVVAVDYGHTDTNRPPGWTLAGFRDGHEVDPVPDGSCDLTAHVAVDTLGADVVTTQREALADLLGERAAVLPSASLAATDAVGYLEALAGANAAATLTAPGGLGDFWWAMTGRGRVGLG